MNEHAEEVFIELWGMYPQQGKQRTVGLKANSKRKHSLSPMERCREATKAALRKVSSDLLVGSLRAYVKRHEEESDCKFIKGLEWWLEQQQWEVEDYTTGNADKLEPKPQVIRQWDTAEGSVRVMLQRMADQGCPEDVLNKLFSDKIGITNVNASKGVPPTAVLRTHQAMTLWYNAASGYAKRAGFNEHAYSKPYYEFARARREREQMTEETTG
jgi:hypothetical protein